MQFYPMWRLKFVRDEARMRQRWPAWRGEGWDREIDTVLKRIADHGPVSIMDVGPDGGTGIRQRPRSNISGDPGGWQSAIAPDFARCMTFPSG